MDMVIEEKHKGMWQQLKYQTQETNILPKLAKTIISFHDEYQGILHLLNPWSCGALSRKLPLNSMTYQDFVFQPPESGLNTVKQFGSLTQT